MDGKSFMCGMILKPLGLGISDWWEGEHTSFHRSMILFWLIGLGMFPYYKNILKFEPIDVEIIQSIPLSTRSLPDRIVWHYDPKGCFSIKYAYVLARHLRQDHVSPSTGSWFRIFGRKCGLLRLRVRWRFIFGVFVPLYYLLLLLWHCKEFLRENGCFFYNNSDETTEHISRDC